MPWSVLVSQDGSTSTVLKHDKLPLTFDFLLASFYVVINTTLMLLEHDLYIRMLISTHNLLSLRSLD